MTTPRRALVRRCVLLGALTTIAFGCAPSRTATEQAAASIAPTASATPSATAPAGAPAPKGDGCAIHGARRPLLARWSPADRKALEGRMRTGIAVVAADDCDGLRLLAGCSVPGRYGYLGEKANAHAVDLAGDEELRVNAPRAASAPAGAAPTGPIRVEVTQVGARASVRAQVTPGDLVGDCKGATHFVASAEIGVARVKARANADATHVDAACSTAKPRELEPPAACSELISASIHPIAELGELITFDHAPEGAVLPIGMCPADMVISEQRCVRPPVDAPYLCAFGDAAGCRRQCERGDINSCDVLGMMTWHGKGLPKDPAGAARLYAKGCDADDRIACGNLGMFFYNGDGVPKDPAKGVQFFERACDLGDTEACAHVGVATVAGIGVRADSQRGMTLIEGGCAAGSSEGCLELATLLLDGDAGKKDEPRAGALLDELCNGHDGKACTFNGRRFFLGAGGVPMDHVRASALFAHGCRAGDGEACGYLGVATRKGDGVTRDDVLATRLLTQSCVLGFAEGCFNLGVAYEHGKGIAADLARAAALYEQACNGSVAASCTYFADALKAGAGLKPDPTRARAIYARACSLGDASACAQSK